MTGVPLLPLNLFIAYGVTHPQTKGITVGDKAHKIGLFANDVILTLSDPQTSLTAVDSILDKFSRVSYYKLNVYKSFALPMGIMGKALQDLKLSFQYQWETNKLTYLGTTLTYPSTQTYEAKYGALWKTILKDFSGIGKFTLSWIGRAAAFKMLTLPKLLYCFHTVTTQVPGSFFNNMDAANQRFIWQGKKP